jgi:UDP-N-acetylglucosamine--N-acetylmuramyl-(pentapeptide) pyrophosphoryl-undecaprenol N-acetylglucosamine transferase
MAAPLFVLAAGGTGGHLFPAEALASELIARGYRVALITDRRGQAFGDRLGAVGVHRIHAASVMGRSITKRLMSFAKIALGVAEAFILLQRLRPVAVIGFGGYPSVPTLLAASRSRWPIVVHEQNAVLGRANRALAPRAKAIATSFAETQAIDPNDLPKVTHTGNPVRPAIRALSDRQYVAPTVDGPVRLLVTGGSQGAKVFGEIVPAAIASLPTEMRRRLHVTQQCRTDDIDRAERTYDDAEVAAELAPFFADIAERIEGAHLAICRAGASTIAEFTVAGLPAIYVPLPSAIDDHQTENARHVEQAGGGWLVAQGEFTPANLARRLFGLLRDPAGLTQAAGAARAAAITNAAQRLADLVERVAMPERVGETV